MGQYKGIVALHHSDSWVADTLQQRAADAATQLVYNSSLKHTMQLQASDPLVALWSLDNNLESALHTTQQKVSTASLIDIAGLGRSSIQLILLDCTNTYTSSKL